MALHDYEKHLSGLFAVGGALSIAAAEAQSLVSDRLGYLGGHQAIASFAEAQSHVGLAMTCTAEGHRKMARISAAAGWKLDDGDNGFGDYAKPPALVARLFDRLAEAQLEAHSN